MITLRALLNILAEAEVNRTGTRKCTIQIEVISVDGWEKDSWLFTDPKTAYDTISMQNYEGKRFTLTIR